MQSFEKGDFDPEVRIRRLCEFNTRFAVKYKNQWVYCYITIYLGGTTTISIYGVTRVWLYESKNYERTFTLKEKYKREIPYMVPKWEVYDAEKYGEYGKLICSAMNAIRHEIV